METMQAWLDGKSCLSHANASSFDRRLLQSLWRYKAEILRLPNFNMLFQVVLKKFQKLTVFVFTESWSRDQLCLKGLYINFAQIKELRNRIISKS